MYWYERYGLHFYFLNGKLDTKGVFPCSRDASGWAWGWRNCLNHNTELIKIESARSRTSGVVNHICSQVVFSNIPLHFILLLCFKLHVMHFSDNWHIYIYRLFRYFYVFFQCFNFNKIDWEGEISESEFTICFVFITVRFQVLCLRRGYTWI